MNFKKYDEMLQELVENGYDEEYLAGLSELEFLSEWWEYLKKIIDYNQARMTILMYEHPELEDII